MPQARTALASPRWAAAVGGLTALAVSLWANQPDVPCERPPVWTLDAAVSFALQNNPELAAARQQRGIAAAGVVIARTYPFNPVLEGRVRYANGPNSAGVTNPVPFEDTVLTELEIRRQGTYRRERAGAALSRTEWEIASQETGVAIRVARAFDTVLYRQEKFHLLQETLRLNEEGAERVRRLVESGRLRAADLIVARTEAAATRVLVGPGRAATVAARYDLNRLLGVAGAGIEPVGALPTPPGQWDRAALIDGALARRADLHARRAAVAEADAALRLEVAGRFGNPTVGPTFEYDPTEVQMIGVQFAVPLPLLNRRRGEILQREAERTRASLELRELEFTVRQDVEAAVGRLEEAILALNTYEARVLPELRQALQGMERLLGQGEVDILRVIDVRRKLVQALDGALDARFEVSQALADLAAALGDPSLLLSPCVLPAPTGDLPPR